MGPVNPVSTLGASGVNGVGSFASVLKDGLNGLNNAVLNSQNITNEFLTGKITNVNEVLIAEQKASLDIQMASQSVNIFLSDMQSLSNLQY